MTKITEASSLSDLGVSSNDIRKIYKNSKLAIRHDITFEPVKTKAQAKARLKDWKLIAGISPDGEVKLLFSSHKNYGTGNYYNTITPTGGRDVHNNLADALAEIAGKGWKFYSSEKSFSPTRQGDHKDPSEIGKPARYPSKLSYNSGFSETLERIYGAKLQAEAETYAQEIKDTLIAFAASDTDTKQKDGERYRDAADYSPGWANRRLDPDAIHMDTLRKSFRRLNAIANADSPYNEMTRQFGLGSVNEVIHTHLKNAPESSRMYSDDYKGGDLFKRNAKLALQKVAQLYMQLLRRFRDKTIEAVKGEQLQPKKPSLGRVYKAWESYKKSGNTKPLS